MTAIPAAAPATVAPVTPVVPRNPWDPPKDLASIEIGVLTRAKNNAMFTHDVGTILDSGHNTPIAMWLEQEHCTQISDIVTLSCNDIHEMDYQNAAGDHELLTQGDANKLIIFIDRYQHWADIDGSILDMETINKEDFDVYRILGYDPDNPYSRNAAAQVPHAAPVPAVPSIAAVPGGTPAELFDRGIKKDNQNSRVKRTGTTSVEAWKQLLPLITLWRS